MKSFSLYGGVEEKDSLESPAIPMQQPSKQYRRVTSKRQIRLLIVDGNALQAEKLGAQLALHDLLPTVVHSAKASWAAVSISNFDVIVLDAVLEEGEDAGFELAQRLRDAGFRQPILFLTARNELADRVRVYEHGDGYLHKPFELPELVAKLGALSRRGSLLPKAVTWRDLELVPAERKVHRGGKLVHLSAVEYEIVELFMLNPGQLFTYDEVIEKVWGMDYIARSNLLAVHIKNIRRKVGDESFVETVRGRGYRLVA